MAKPFTLSPTMMQDDLKTSIHIPETLIRSQHHVGLDNSLFKVRKDMYDMRNVTTLVNAASAAEAVRKRAAEDA